MNSVTRGAAVRGALAAATTVVALASAMHRPDQDPLRGALRSRIEILRTSGRLVVAGDPVRFPTAVAELYEWSGFAPLWGSAAAAAFPAAIAGLAHVPPGIVGEVLAAARRSPGYLTREGIRVLDARGRVVDPRTVDFSRYSAATFPYAFRQDPGPRNPLGRIKFGLPNRYNVYLHDTPARQLFDREDRTFSHGCVRVEDPVRLAELVLDDAAWDRQAIESAIASGRTRSVSLRHPMAVLIQYWTASADHDGRLRFYPDRYRRDPAVLAELDRP